MSATMLCAGAAVATADTADVLTRILAREVHLAVWRRPLAEALRPLAALDWDGIDDIDAQVPVADLAEVVPGLLDGAGYRAVAAPAHEIVARARDLAAVLDCATLRIRLDVIDTDACRKFHVDQVTVRLLLPLVGPGTQWRAADRDGIDGQLRPGDVGLFKGRLWADPPAILHRSPPIEADGGTRLLLAIDPVVERQGSKQHRI